PDKARPLARQRHQSEGSARGVKFGRGVAMRARMLEAQRDRDLRIVVRVDADAGCVAAQRAAPVGADDELACQRAAGFNGDRDLALAGLDAAYVVVDDA